MKNKDRLFAKHLIPGIESSSCPTAEQIALLNQRDKFTIGIDPYKFPVQVRDDLPSGVFYMMDGDRVQRIRLEWDDKEKKNKVIVDKYNSRLENESGNDSKDSKG